MIATDRRSLLSSATLQQASTLDKRIGVLFECAASLEPDAYYRRHRTYQRLKSDLCEMVGRDAMVLSLRDPRYYEVLTALLFDVLPEEL